MHEQAVTACYVEDTTATAESPHASRQFPRFVQLLTRQAADMAHHAADAIEECRSLEPAEIMRRQAAACARREAHATLAASEVAAFGSLMSHARPSACSVRMPIQLKSISYHARPWRALVG